MILLFLSQKQTTMNIEELRDYCLSLKGVTEDTPFDETSLVFKVIGKIFCITDLKDKFSVALKNDPEKNIELREEYPSVKPGYHLNKMHWNTIEIDSSIQDDFLKNLIDESYDLVVLKLKKEEKQQLKSIK